MLGFGPHLVFDGHGCPAARLGNMGALYGLLDALPERIRMSKIMPPYVFDDALAALRDAFAPHRADRKLLDRGREFPKQIGATRAMVGRHRRAVARNVGLEASS